MFNFVKYSATGNDFVAIDDREEKFDPSNWELVKKICDRRFGIGADGVLLLRRNKEGQDFSMIILNSDGSRPAMCGNGTRALVHFAHFVLKLKNDPQYTFSTDNGNYKGEVVGDEIKVLMAELYDETDVDQSLYPAALMMYSLNTGVPHLVIEVKNVEQVNIEQDAPPLRHHAQFKNGSNVNFFEIKSAKEQKLKLRTFERGVEGETLACGTGVMATAIACARKKGWRGLISVETSGGVLKVDLDQDLNQRYFQGKVDLTFTGHYE